MTFSRPFHAARAAASALALLMLAGTCLAASPVRYPITIVSGGITSSVAYIVLPPGAVISNLPGGGVQADLGPILSGVDASITNGLASVSITNGLARSSITNGFASSSITNGLASASITNGLASSSITNGLASASITNGLASSSVTNGLASSSVTNGLAPASITNGLATASVTNGLASSSVTNGLATASITNGLASASVTNGLASSSITNGLASSSITNGLPTSSITNGLASSSITNGLATGAVTNGLASSSVTNGLASSSITNGLASSSITNGLASASITNGLASASITNGLASSSVTNGLASSSITNGLASSSITNGLASASITNGLPTSSITNGLASASITNGLATSSITNGLLTAASTLIPSNGVLFTDLGGGSNAASIDPSVVLTAGAPVAAIAGALPASGTNTLANKADTANAITSTALAATGLLTNVPAANTLFVETTGNDTNYVIGDESRPCLTASNAFAIALASNAVVQRIRFGAGWFNINNPGTTPIVVSNLTVEGAGKYSTWLNFTNATTHFDCKAPAGGYVYWRNIAITQSNLNTGSASATWIGESAFTGSYIYENVYTYNTYEAFDGVNGSNYWKNVDADVVTQYGGGSFDTMGTAGLLGLIIDGCSFRISSGSVSNGFNIGAVIRKAVVRNSTFSFTQTATNSTSATLCGIKSSDNGTTSTLDNVQVILNGTNAAGVYYALQGPTANNSALLVGAGVRCSPLSITNKVYFVAGDDALAQFNSSTGNVTRALHSANNIALTTTNAFIILADTNGNFYGLISTNGNLGLTNFGTISP